MTPGFHHSMPRVNALDAGTRSQELMPGGYHSMPVGDHPAGRMGLCLAGRTGLRLVWWAVGLV